MCKVSDKIKFCTCSSDTINIDELDSYWILYRYNDKKEREITIGSFYIIGNLEFDSSNKITILNRLKESDAFDIPIQFNNQDSLVIHIDQFNHSNELLYYFQFIDGEWLSQEYNPFSISDSSDEFKFGKLDNAIEEKE